MKLRESCYEHDMTMGKMPWRSRDWHKWRIALLGVIIFGWNLGQNDHL